MILEQAGDSKKKKPPIRAALSLGRKRPTRASQHLCCTATVLLIDVDINVKIAAAGLISGFCQAPLPAAIKAGKAFLLVWLTCLPTFNAYYPYIRRIMAMDQDFLPLGKSSMELGARGLCP